jgi:hypothetical protein
VRYIKTTLKNISAHSFIVPKRASMKTTLPVLLFIVVSITSAAQITTPVIKANFGVDADLRANYFNGSLFAGNDDWFKQGKIGLGEYMIDTTGAAAIAANYISNPASRMLSFSRLMKPAFYSTVQNSLVIDAVFHRDFHGDDSTVFASGSNKNGMSPASWSCPVAQGIPDKNDILDGFTHVRRAGPNVSDSLWMFGGLSIENTNGNRYFDFELYQTDIFYDRATRTFGGYGPNAGHTAWQFDAAGNVLTAGDIIFSEEFSSSSLSLIEARIWIKKTSLAITPVNFKWGGQFDGDGSSATYGYASILPKTAGDFYTGLQSATPTWAGPFSLVRTDNSVVTDYIPGQFMEFSVNLTKLGVDPGSYSNNPCGTPFRRVLIKTRSSTSFTSELKDFIAPFRMFDFPKVDAYSYILYFCRTFPLTPIEVLNPSPTSIYTWTTSNGHIVGSNTGPLIYVDAPGTYWVTQQLSAQCSMYSMDSVKLIFDSICRVLDVDIRDFNVKKDGERMQLQWQVSNNSEALNFEMEYSLNAVNFNSIGTMKATNAPDQENYMYSYLAAKNTNPIVYYRIKITGKDGRIKYSNIALLHCNDKDNNTPIIFPNPTAGELWLDTKNILSGTADVSTWNAQGKLISHATVKIMQGEYILKLPGLDNYPPGVYLIKIKSATGSITQRIIKPE